MIFPTFLELCLSFLYNLLTASWFDFATLNISVSVKAGKDKRRNGVSGF
jgi:hypothetical protein